MAKKKKKKNPFRILILLSMMGISAFCIFAVYNEIRSTFSLQAEIKTAETVKKQLSEEKATLEKQQKNLNDPNYIVRYARGKHMVTKDDGEQVFKIQTEDNKDE